MPDPLPPTVAISPAGYLVEFKTGAKAWGERPHPENDETGPYRSVEALYRRDDIAPLRVPLVDQHNNVMGHEYRKARELLIERVWTDKDGVVWSRPTAFAYAAACEARHQTEMELGTVRGLLAALVDANPHAHEPEQWADWRLARAKAKEYLNRPKDAAA